MPRFDPLLPAQDGLGFVGRIYKHLADKVTLSPERSTDNVVQAASATAVPFVVKRFSAGSTADLLQLQDETGAVLTGFGSSGLGGALTAVFSTQGVLGVTVGTGSFPVPRVGSIVGVLAVVNTAPVGASLICDVNLNGTTVFTTQANRPTITSGSFISALVVPDVTTVALLNVLTVDVDQVGVSVAGSDLTTVVLIA